mgnify:FL=1
MTEAMYDLIYLIDALVRILMMLSIISIIIYFIRHFKECAKKKYESLNYGRIHNEE